MSRFLLLLGLLGLSACAASIGGPEAGPDAGEAPGPGDGDDDDTPDSTCSGDPCDLFDQCGCPAGDACGLDPASFATAGTTCRDADSDGDGTRACSADTECAIGFACLGSPGQCRRLCDAGTDCGAGRCGVQIVYDTGDGSTADVPGAKACTKSCKLDVGTGGGCPEVDGVGCRFYGDEEGWFTDCSAAATTGGGDAASCTAGSGACAPGFECFSITYTDDSVRDECRQMCIVSISGAPVEGACGVGTCRALGGEDPLVVGDIEYGLCY